ncbi:MAG: hypothetical protein ACOCXR_01940 [Phototrophicaceae bacterium]
MITYGQDIRQFTNASLIYTFVGLTDDGESIIPATFPLNAEGLPDEPDQDLDYTACAEDYAAYLNGVTNTLDALEPDQFTPSLDTLDGIIGSSHVEQPTTGRIIKRLTRVISRFLI